MAEGSGCSSPDQGAIVPWGGPGGPHQEHAPCPCPRAGQARPAGLQEDSFGAASSVRAPGPLGQLGGPQEASPPLAVHPWALLGVLGPGPLCVTSLCPGRGLCWFRCTLSPLPLNFKKGGMSVHSIELTAADAPLNEVVRSERQAVPTRIGKWENGASRLPPAPWDCVRSHPRGHSYCPALICCHFDFQHLESRRWTDVEVSLARGGGPLLERKVGAQWCQPYRTCPPRGITYR